MENSKFLNEPGSHYNVIGSGYAQTRSEDPSLYNRIIACLESSKSVVNVGAGTGSYEPRDRHTLAIEPSEVMVRQRGEHRAPVIRATAEDLPLHDKSFWAHPERVLDPAARAETSGFARQPREVVERVVSQVSRDLANGQWDKKYNHLRKLNEFDAGL